ncbi:hypothetical protein Nepgr_000808 [Nepenthes gracilis]|uniref:Uncharacterized protein n=1 Tax=Nepenthes gracilis TaxID=150966 RepID=A0AAD3RWG6_NEPGR|nr:hypothetical protein Nepgr_000808 [Nepenthes gracilis]
MPPLPNSYIIALHTVFLQLYTACRDSFRIQKNWKMSPMELGGVQSAPHEGVFPSETGLMQGTVNIFGCFVSSEWLYS